MVEYLQVRQYNIVDLVVKVDLVVYTHIFSLN